MTRKPSAIHILSHLSPKDWEPSFVNEVKELLEPIDKVCDELGSIKYCETEPATKFRIEPRKRNKVDKWASIVRPLDSTSIPAVSCNIGEIPWLSVREIAILVLNKIISPKEVLQSFVDAIDRNNSRLNAYIAVNDKHVENMLDNSNSFKQYTTGRLAGVPLAVKDLIDTRSMKTTYGSSIYKNHRPKRDAISWRRLAAEGAVLLGKSNTQEFAAGVTGDNDFFGPVKNPWNTNAISGGSSSGSAAAVASAMAAAALGTDTGGSIRLPAGMCGVVGIKPTFGSVPTGGVQTLSWSLDHVGPITRSVADAAVILEILSNDYGYEAASIRGQHSKLDKVKIGIPPLWMDGIDSRVLEKFEGAIALLTERGASLTLLPDLLSPYVLTILNRVIAYAEASQVHERLLRANAEFGKEIKARMVAGQYIPIGEYLAAQQVRETWCKQLDGVWRDVDVLVTPTLPCQTPTAGQKVIEFGHGEESIGSALVRFTAPFNLSGSPALSLPCAFIDGLPMGLQLVGPAHSEALLCFVASAIENELELDLRPPQYS